MYNPRPGGTLHWQVHWDNNRRVSFRLFAQAEKGKGKLHRKLWWRRTSFSHFFYRSNFSIFLTNLIDHVPVLLVAETLSWSVRNTDRDTDWSKWNYVPTNTLYQPLFSFFQPFFSKFTGHLFLKNKSKMVHSQNINTPLRDNFRICSNGGKQKTNRVLRIENVQKISITTTVQ